jgi:hypothetical protein
MEFLTKDSQPFVVNGSHSMVTACTLPAWLPAHIIDAMNGYFGSLLRKELVALRGHFESQQDQIPSMPGLHGSMNLFDYPTTKNALCFSLPEEDHIPVKPLRAC